MLKFRLVIVVSFTVLLLALAGCRGMVAPPEATTLTVMTYNIYVGTEVAGIFTLADPALVPGEISKMYGNIVASDFPRRAAAIAKSVKEAQPHLIGLQEVSLIRFGGNEFSFRAILMSALEAADLDYEVVAEVQNAHIELGSAALGRTNHSTDSRSVGGSAARTAALAVGSAGVAGADRRRLAATHERELRRATVGIAFCAPAARLATTGRSRASDVATLKVYAWSTRSMAKPESATVSRIWRAFGLKPHRCETFKLSRDPLFIGRYATSWVCTCIRPSVRWCCAWTRSRRFKRWTAASYCPCVVSGAPTTTAAMEPRRCLRPWT